MSDSVCWSCGRTSNECSWMRDFIPVNGWKAKRYDYISNECPGDSYIVTFCPKFKYNGICNRCIYYKNGEFLDGCRNKTLHYSECLNSHNKFITHDMEEE